MPRTIASVGAVERSVGDSPTQDALLTAFLSFTRGRAPASVAAYKAAARHFLYWLEQQGIAVAAIDDGVVERFEKHQCRCRPFPLHEPNRPAFKGRVRRLVRFLEDHGAVDVADDVDCLANHLADYAVFLEQQQYSAVSIKSYRSEAAHFAAWIRITRQRWAEIGAEQIEQYAHHDCRCPVYRKRGRLVGRHGPLRRARGARRFLGFLRDRSVLSDAAAPEHGDSRLQAYQAWLKGHCGSADGTVLRYSGEIRRCLPMLGEPQDLDAATIRKVISHRIAQAPGSAAQVVSTVRSYMRFLISRGDCPPGLLHAFPSARRYRSGTLPRYLDEPTIETIIASCRAETAVDIRDRAIIFLLARLGLRAGDVCHLRLSDIDWAAGCIRVCGKGRRPDRLPLPQDAGDAVLAYLERARPRVEEDRVFVRAQAPFTPFKSSAEICGIISRVFDRAGITDLPTRSHVFRHSLATRMLRSGAGLESIGVILRHRSPATTAIYAKVDVPMLLKVAQPWPGDVSC